MKQTIIDLLKILADGIKQESSDQCFSYVQQRQMIGRMFGKYDQKDYGMAKVMLRLTVIDSLYSTNAAYSYFSIEEMAEKIIEKTARDAANSTGDEDTAPEGKYYEDHTPKSSGFKSESDE